MDIFFKLILNLLVTLPVGGVLYAARMHVQRDTEIGKSFYLAGLTVLFMLLLESLTVWLKASPGLRLLEAAACSLLFSAPPVLAFCWLRLTEALTGGHSAKEKLRWFLLPIGFNALLAVASPIFGLLFFFDGTGAVHRGPLYPAFILCTALYLLAPIIWPQYHLKEMLTTEFRALLFIPLPAVLGGYIQVISRLPLGWEAVSCSYVLLYVYLQEYLLRTDGLTGACSRAYFEYCLSRTLAQNTREVFGMIYLDVDNFKAVNDRFGHLAGDEALKALVSIIKSLLRRTDTISRLGGDEFGILVQVESEAALKAVAEKMERTLAENCCGKGSPCQLSCSMGMKLLHKSSALRVEDILSQVDRLMYGCKKNRRKGATS